MLLTQLTTRSSRPPSERWASQEQCPCGLSLTSQRLRFHNFLLLGFLKAQCLDHFSSPSTCGPPACTIKPLQLIQNAAARMVFNEPKKAHITPLLIRLHWLPVTAHIKFKVLMSRSSRGLMDRALDLKPEVTQGCGFESRLWQEVSTTEVRPLSKAPNPQLLPGRRNVGCPLLQVCVHLDGLNAENSLYSV